MTRYVSGTCRRKEGERDARLYSVITCDQCGTSVHERKASKIQQILKAECSACKSLQAKQRDQQRKERQAAEKSFWDSLGFEGATGHPLYKRWVGMRSRCESPSQPIFAYYGARGITVCDRWQDFKNFIQDVGLPPGPLEEYDLHRFDNDKGYEPGNVVWMRSVDHRRLHRRLARCLVPNAPAIPDERYREVQREHRAARRKEYHQKTYQRRPLGWWREEFGLYNNPYIYGPMPWKRTGIAWRKAESQGLFDGLAPADWKLP